MEEVPRWSVFFTDHMNPIIFRRHQPNYQDVSTSSNQKHPHSTFAMLLAQVRQQAAQSSTFSEITAKRYSRKFLRCPLQEMERVEYLEAMAEKDRQAAAFDEKKKKVEQEEEKKTAKKRAKRQRRKQKQKQAKKQKVDGDDDDESDESDEDEEEDDTPEQ